MRSDAELQEAISRYMAERPDVNHGEVDIQVRQGTVTLTGKMHSELEKWQVEDDIRGMPGVEGLLNHTVIGPSNIRWRR
jgi:osmotically-inducible protein OsmY